MALSAILLVLLASPALAADDAKNRPVSKVITLLNDMVAQLTKEAEEDKETFEAMDCWCTTNDKAKTKAIADAEQTILDLTAAIDGYTATAARLNTEIANLEKEVAENSDALGKATSVRQKELAEFNNEEKESLQTISSLKSAVGALSKHHEGASLLQAETSPVDFTSDFVMIQHKMHKHADFVAGLLTKEQRKAVTAFLQDPDSYFNKAAAPRRHVTGFVQYHPAYEPASGQIFGLMKQMKEGFETNLAASQAEEMKAQGDFEGMKKAKTEEIAAGEAQIETKSEELGNTDEKNAQSKTLLAETRTTLAADTKFLANLKEQCANVDAEYAERTKTRQLEITAVGKAKAFLTSDDAQDLVSRTLNFVQQRSTVQSHRRSKVLEAVAKAAQVSGDPRLSALAVQAKLDAFTKVKKSIQDMIDTLAKEQEDEVKHKDFCVDEINTNEKETQKKQQQDQTQDERIADEAELIAKMKKKIQECQAAIADLQIQMKRASEDREKMNAEFQTTVADQRATQKLLAGALNILKGFYEKAALIQKHTSKQEPAGPPPPPGFKSYANNAQSGGVMAMIQQIIDDAKAMEADAIKAEEESQIAYETLVTDTNNSIEANNKEIVSSKEVQGKAESDKVEAEQEKDAVMEELEVLSSENADLHKSCDYTLKNFDLRQGARQAEMEALKQALSLLSGAVFSAFLQRN